MSISTISHCFYIVVINFVINFSSKFDCLLTIIDKFSYCLQLLVKYVTNFVAI